MTRLPTPQKCHAYETKAVKSQVSNYGSRPTIPDENGLKINVYTTLCPENVAPTTFVSNNFKS